MIEVNLTKALCAFIEQAVKDFRLERAPRIEERTPGSLFEDPPVMPEPQKNGVIPIKVYNGWLPDKEQSHPNDFPFITVRPTGGVVKPGCSSCSIDIVIGTYSADSQGYLDVMNVLQRVLMNLSILQNNTLDDKYERVNDMTWQLPFDQPEPFYQAVISTEWNIYKNDFYFV